MCGCACKKRQNNTIVSGLYRFRVHCAKLKKNNNSDNKLGLVLRNASIVILVLVKFNSQICSPAVTVFLTSCAPLRCGGSIQRRLLLLVLPALSATLTGGRLARQRVSSREPRVDGGWCRSSDHHRSQRVAELQDKG